jgi:hypothetical protein
MSANAAAKKHAGNQSTFSRHLRLHLKPQAEAIARIVMPVVMPPSTPIDLLPSLDSCLRKLGHMIDRAEALVADAERDGSIPGRAASLNALKGALVDTAKLLAVLAPQRPEPTSDQIDRKAVRDALASVSVGDQEGVLERLLT